MSSSPPPPTHTHTRAATSTWWSPTRWRTSGLATWSPWPTGESSGSTRASPPTLSTRAPPLVSPRGGRGGGATVDGRLGATASCALCPRRQRRGPPRASAAVMGLGLQACLTLLWANPSVPPSPPLQPAPACASSTSSTATTCPTRWPTTPNAAATRCRCLRVRRAGWGAAARGAARVHARVCGGGWGGVGCACVCGCVGGVGWGGVGVGGAGLLGGALGPRDACSPGPRPHPADLPAPHAEQPR